MGRDIGAAGGQERGTEDEKRVGKRGARKGGARGDLEWRAKEGAGEDGRREERKRSAGERSGS